jgi:hypothetical protein
MNLTREIGTVALIATDAVSGVLDGSGRHPMKVSQDGIELKTKSETTVTTFDLIYPPRGASPAGTPTPALSSSW